MQQLLLVLQVLLAASIITLVLLQQGRGADAGASFGGGSSGSLFGSRGPASFLAKITALIATIFFVNSIGLAYLASQGRTGSSIVDTLNIQSESKLPPQPEIGTVVDDDVPKLPGTDTTTSETDVPSVPENSTKSQ